MIHERDEDYIRYEGGDDAQPQDKYRAKYGKDIDEYNAKNLADGVQRTRACTDILCLLLFFATIGAMGYASFYGFKHGDVNRLTAPLDGDWRFCGSDPEVKQFQKLYITKLGITTNINDIFKTGVCVRACPKKDEVIAAADFAKTSTFVDATIKAEYTTLSVMDFCLPSNKHELPDDIKKGFEMVQEQFRESPGASYIEDISKAGKAVKYSFLTGILYAFVFIYLMSAFAEPIAWLCIVLVQLGLIGVTGLLWTYRT